MQTWKHCFATKKLIFDVHGVALKGGGVTRKHGAVAYKRGTVIVLLFNFHVPTKDFEPTKGLKNLALQKKKVFESDLTLLPLFFQLMYVQTPKRTDCFPNILVTLSGKDPRWMDIPKNNRDSPTGWDNNLSALLFETTPVPTSSARLLQWIAVKDKFSSKLVETLILHFFFFSYRKKLLIKHFRKKNFPSCIVVENLFCPLN